MRPAMVRRFALASSARPDRLPRPLRVGCTNVSRARPATTSSYHRAWWCFGPALVDVAVAHRSVRAGHADGAEVDVHAGEGDREVRRDHVDDVGGLHRRCASGRSSGTRSTSPLIDEDRGNRTSTNQNTSFSPALNLPDGYSWPLK